MSQLIQWRQETPPLSFAMPNLPHKHKVHLQHQDIFRPRSSPSQDCLLPERARDENRLCETELEQPLVGGGRIFFNNLISKSENQVGGSMGLWLGLGILQALQLFFTIIIAIIITIVITIIIIPIIIVIIVIVIPPGIAAGWRRLQGLDWTFQQKEAEECWKNS